MKHLLLTAALAALAVPALADKTMYLPVEWRNRTDTLIWSENDPDNRYTWSKSRSRETDNVIVLWDKYYGDKAPDQLPTSSPYYVNINDLLAKCESFFDLELNTLGFVNPQTSNLSRYKVMVLMNHTTDWACYGGGYDYQVSALWLSPNTCKPVGSAVAHEIGHSFHYMCYSEASNHGAIGSQQTGFHSAVGKGSVTWEQTAQWQSLQSYPGEMFDQSIGIFRKSHNLAFTHEWHRYQSYWFFYYLCQYLDDLTAVASLWNYNTTSVIDVNQALMRSRSWNVAELFRRYYDYAARCATWDFDVAASYRNAYIGDFEYRAVSLGDAEYQVAAASAPQGTGFNVIPLTVPAAGTEIKARFTALKPNAALADGDPGEMLNGESQFEALGRSSYPSTGKDAQKGFRLGFVALLRNGTRQYFNADSIYCRGAGEKEAELSMTVPENTSRLWMIVSPAPSAYYQHKWDDNPLAGDDIWPYRVSFDETDIDSSTGKVKIYVSTHFDEADVHDVTFDYNVRIPTNSNYATTAVTISPAVQMALAYAFQMQPAAIIAALTPYASGEPAKGKVMYCAANETGVLKFNASARTNATYGNWFDASGNLKPYGTGSVVFCDFAPSDFTFAVGYHPSNARAGTTYIITPALRYHAPDGTKVTARFRLHVTTGGSSTGGAELIQITDGIAAPMPAGPAAASDSRCYDLSGRQVTPSSALPCGIYILNGRKVVR